MSKGWIEDYFGKDVELIASDCIVVKDRLGRMFVAGSPEDEGRDENEGHNCDAMGCGTFGPHIIMFKESSDE